MRLNLNLTTDNFNTREKACHCGPDFFKVSLHTSKDLLGIFFFLNISLIPHINRENEKEHIH